MGERTAFIYVLSLVRNVDPESMTQSERAIVDEHFNYLERKLRDGELVLAGRCSRGEFGIVIFYAESEAKAMDFMKNDPAIKGGVMTAELHTFHIALYRNAIP